MVDGIDVIDVHTSLGVPYCRSTSNSVLNTFQFVKLIFKPKVLFNILLFVQLRRF